MGRSPTAAALCPSALGRGLPVRGVRAFGTVWAVMRAGGPSVPGAVRAIPRRPPRPGVRRADDQISRPREVHPGYRAGAVVQPDRS
jgi:hypothetical protein